MIVLVYLIILAASLLTVYWMSPDDFQFYFAAIRRFRG